MKRLSLLTTAILAVVFALPAQAAGKKHAAKSPASSIRMVRIPAGSFMMGCQDGHDSDCDNDEKPAHQVNLKAFELGKTEVTVGQFRAFVQATGYHTDAENNTTEKGCLSEKEAGKFDWVEGLYWDKPGFNQTDLHPVVCVSWNDTQAFVQWLSKTKRQAWRLPTEAEWEYAARAGTQTSRYWGDDPDQSCRYANVGDQTTKVLFPNVTVHNCNDGQRYTAPVGSYVENAYKLHDMIGNIWEWTQDYYSENYNGAPTDGSARNTAGDGRHGELRVPRGGSYLNDPQYARAALRGHFDPANRNGFLGFRIARTLP